MLDENHNDRCWKLLHETFDDCLVYRRDRSVLKASGHVLHDREARLFAVMPVHQPTDHSVKQDDKCGSECRDEEKCLRSIWHPSSPEVTGTPYHVEHSQSRQAHSSIELGPTQMLQNIDDDLVRGVPVGEPGDTH